MGKREEYQRFRVALRELSDRPCLLVPLFDRGATVEEAKLELAQFKRNDFRMFKHAAHGVPDKPQKRISRIMTTDSLRQRALVGALRELLRSKDIRMTGEARQWLDSTIVDLRQKLRRRYADAD